VNVPSLRDVGAELTVVDVGGVDGFSLLVGETSEVKLEVLEGIALEQLSELDES